MHAQPSFLHSLLIVLMSLLPPKLHILFLFLFVFVIDKHRVQLVLPLGRWLCDHSLEYEQSINAHVSKGE